MPPAAQPPSDYALVPPNAGGTLVEVNGLTKHFPMRLGGFFGGFTTVRAAQDVSFRIARGETLGLVGESGCGKTTVGRVVLQLEKATGGQILFDGEDLATVSSQRMKALRTRIQVIFQDPYSSLNPRMTVGGTITEPLRKRLGFTAPAAQIRVDELLDQVGLLREMGERYPHQLSGGQRQRVGIARALAMEPDFIVCDEPVSALDVSIQGQIVNLLAELQVECLESFFSSLVAGKTGPFMVAPIGTELGLGQIGLGLMQPVKRAVHPPMMPFATGFTTGFGRGRGPRRDQG
jgi:peptide/nickel transport system ATP-binding protein